MILSLFFIFPHRIIIIIYSLINIKFISSPQQLYFIPQIVFAIIEYVNYKFFIIKIIITPFISKRIAKKST
jgi:hypothetical protein